MATDSTWLCIENHPTDGLRVSNLPGGLTHCYFTGTAHLPDCGYVDLEAARRVANPNLKAMLRMLWEHFYDDMEGNPSDPDEAWEYNREWSEIQMSGLPERLWNAALGITTDLPTADEVFGILKDDGITTEDDE